MQKLLEQIKQNPIIEGCFYSSEDVFENFSVPEKDRKYIEIIYANYETPSYEGYASVLFYNNQINQYCEVYGSHCSCYGLEGQWSSEIIQFNELEQRLVRNNFFGSNEFKRLYESYIKS